MESVHPVENGGTPVLAQEAQGRHGGVRVRDEQRPGEALLRKARGRVDEEVAEVPERLKGAVGFSKSKSISPQ